MTGLARSRVKGCNCGNEIADILQDCRCNKTNVLFSNTPQRLWCLIKRMADRYKQWEVMKHNHRLLLTMEDRMLEDIGLSRADAVRISNAYTFMGFMFQQESDSMKKKGPGNREDIT